MPATCGSRGSPRTCTRENIFIDLLTATRSWSPPGHTRMVELTTRRARAAVERLRPHAHHPRATSEGGGDAAACVNGAALAVGRFRRRGVCRQVHCVRSPLLPLRRKSASLIVHSRHLTRTRAAPATLAWSTRTIFATSLACAAHSTSSSSTAQSRSCSNHRAWSRENVSIHCARGGIRACRVRVDVP